MSEKSPAGDRKEALKKLKAERKASIDRAAAHVKAVNRMMGKIKKALAAGPRTVPQLAQASGLSTADALWCVMAMKKYGQVAEGKKERTESYYPYELVPSDDAE